MRRRDFLRRGLGLLAAAGTVESEGRAVAGGRAAVGAAAGLPGGARRGRDLSFLYQPGPAALSVMCTGDTILYRSLQGLAGDDFDDLFEVQRDADMAITNCELVFSQAGYPQPKDVAYAPPQVADQLAWEGIDMVTVANNHLMDLGPDAMLETLDVLRRRGIVPAGGGEDLEAATAPGILVCKDIRVGLLSFLCIPPPVATDSAAGENAPGLAVIPGYRIRVSSGPAGARRFMAPEAQALRTLEDAVARARPKVDVLLVGFHMHWGDRYGLDEGRKIITRASIEAGADMVFAHGPHVISPVELYKGRLIFHSLGNFVFHIFEDNWFSARYGANWPGITKGVYSFTTSTEYWEGLAPRLIVGRDGIRRAQILPVAITRDGDPRFPDPEQGRAIMEDLRTMSEGMAELELGDWHAEVGL